MNRGREPWIFAAFGYGSTDSRSTFGASQVSFGRISQDEHVGASGEIGLGYLRRPNDDHLTNARPLVSIQNNSRLPQGQLQAERVVVHSITIARDDATAIPTGTWGGHWTRFRTSRGSGLLVRRQFKIDPQRAVAAVRRRDAVPRRGNGVSRRRLNTYLAAGRAPERIINAIERRMGESGRLFLPSR
jgi:hypothetical protein